MKITFIAYKENSIHFFKELARDLSKKISGLILEERFVPEVEDIPFVAQESTKNSDFVFVFLVNDDEEENDLIKEKLIDIELKTKTRILKVVENEVFDYDNEAEYDEEKDNLAEKYSDMIVSILFNERDFEPEEKDFGL